MAIYSKGAQGLSVMLYISRIFTTISISVSPSWRQRGSRYTIHAGRNLPDKEFRYLWTVRVTAAVYGGLLQKPRLLNFTLPHRAGVSPYTSSYDFAETCVFTKQSPPPISCQHPQKSVPPFSEDTVSFCRVPSTWLPHCLCGIHMSTCVGLQYGAMS